MPGRPSSHVRPCNPSEMCSRNSPPKTLDSRLAPRLAVSQAILPATRAERRSQHLHEAQELGRVVPQRIRITSLTAMSSRMYVGRSASGQAGPAPAGTMQAVAQEMICTSSHLYEACHELFTRYPLAVETADHGGSVASSIVLMLRDRDDARFFLLSHQSSEGTPSYSLSPWPTGDIIQIEADYNDAVPDVIVKAVTCGVPIPREGSLFGWSFGDTITALVAVYTRYTSASPVPSWAMMPLVGIPDTQWPPFADERFFGRWFWEHYRAGNITLLDDLIAEVPEHRLLGRHQDYPRLGLLRRRTRPHGSGWTYALTWPLRLLRSSTNGQASATPDRVARRPQ